MLSPQQPARLPKVTNADLGVIATEFTLKTGSQSDTVTIDTLFATDFVVRAKAMTG
jgi:hypothetical protein